MDTTQILEAKKKKKHAAELTKYVKARAAQAKKSKDESVNAVLARLSEAMGSRFRSAMKGVFQKGVQKGKWAATSTVPAAEKGSTVFAGGKKLRSDMKPGFQRATDSVEQPAFDLRESCLFFGQTAPNAQILNG